MLQDKRGHTRQGTPIHLSRVSADLLLQVSECNRELSALVVVKNFPGHSPRLAMIGREDPHCQV